MTLNLDDLEAKAKAATPGMHKDEIVEHAKKCDLGNQSCHNCPALKCCDNTSPAKAVLAAVPELIERCRKSEANATTPAEREVIEAAKKYKNNPSRLHDEFGANIIWRAVAALEKEKSR